MAEITFHRLGGDVSKLNITEEISVKDALDRAGVKYQTGDDIRIQGKSVGLDTKITPDQAQFVTAVPKVKGGIH